MNEEQKKNKDILLKMVGKAEEDILDDVMLALNSPDMSEQELNDYYTSHFDTFKDILVAFLLEAKTWLVYQKYFEIKEQYEVCSDIQKIIDKDVITLTFVSNQFFVEPKDEPVEIETIQEAIHLLKKTIDNEFGQ